MPGLTLLVRCTTAAKAVGTKASDAAPLILAGTPKTAVSDAASNTVWTTASSAAPTGAFVAGAGKTILTRPVTFAASGAVVDNATPGTDVSKS